MTIFTSLLIVPDAASGLSSFQFDAQEDESHTKAIVVTEHPIENGSTIADHIVETLPEFSITGHISNTPINDQLFDLTSAGSQVGGILTFSGARDFAREAFELLEKYQTNKVLLEIITGMKLYKAMILKEIKPKRGSGGAKFDLSFRQVKIVSASTVNAPKPLEPKAAPKKSGGNAAPNQPKPSKEELQSLAYKALQGAGAL